MREAAERSIAQVRENEKGAENLINESSRVIIECLNANTLNKIAAIRVKLSTELQQLHSKHNDENNCFRDTGSNQNGNRNGRSEKIASQPMHTTTSAGASTTPRQSALSGRIYIDARKGNNDGDRTHSATSLASTASAKTVEATIVGAKRKIAVVSPTANVANAASLGVGASFGAAALSQHPILHPRKGHSSRRPDDAVDSVVTRVQQAYAQASSSSSSARKGRDIETRAKEGEDCDGNNHRGVAVGGGGFESYDNEDSDSVREMAAELQLLVKGVEFRWGDSNDEEQQQQQQPAKRSAMRPKESCKVTSTATGTIRTRTSQLRAPVKPVKSIKHAKVKPTTLTNSTDTIRTRTSQLREPVKPVKPIKYAKVKPITLTNSTDTIRTRTSQLREPVKPTQHPQHSSVKDTKFSTHNHSMEPSPVRKGQRGAEHSKVSEPTTSSPTTTQHTTAKEVSKWQSLLHGPCTPAEDALLLERVAQWQAQGKGRGLWVGLEREMRRGREFLFRRWIKLSNG